MSELAKLPSANKNPKIGPNRRGSSKKDDDEEQKDLPKDPPSKAFGHPTDSDLASSDEDDSDEISVTSAEVDAANAHFKTLSAKKLRRLQRKNRNLDRATLRQFRQEDALNELIDESEKM